MSIEKIKLELPAKLQDIFQFSFNFDNLIKVVDYLFNNNLIMIKEIKDLKSRIFNLELLQPEIEKLKLKTNLIQKTNDNINRSFAEMRDKVSKNDLKINEYKKKIDEFNIKIEKNENSILGHDTNINNLNKVVEENVKTLKHIQENFGMNLDKFQKLEQEINEINKKNELLGQNNNKLIEENNNNEKKIELINNNITEINESINILRKNTEKKNRDFDNCINNIMDTISTLPSKGVNVETNDKNLFKLSMNEIEREREKFNSFLEENKLNQDKRDKENIIIKNNIDILKMEIKKLSNRFTNKNKGEEKDEKEDKSDKSLSKVNEYIKNLMKSIQKLPNREEFELLNKNFMLKIKKLEGDNNRVLSLVSKVTNNLNNNEKKDNISMSYLNNLIENLRNSFFNEIKESFKDMLKKEGPNLDISNNPKLIEIIKIITQHTEEINNNNKSVIDLRKTIFAIDADKKFDDLSSKLLQVEEDTDRNKKKIIDIIKTIEGCEELDENGEGIKYDPSTIKGHLEYLDKQYNNLGDKLMLIESKNKSLSKEIKEEIKANLKAETLKIVGKFREKLEMFTHRFEEELKNKIDQMGLYNFEKKINNKIFYDLKDTLKKKEMKKNNHAINRKIDSLENKISKTLVDTIIDLQMDEAPLIIKKTPNNLEKCASCNQYIQKDRCYIAITEQNDQSYQKVNKNNLINSPRSNLKKTFYGLTRTPSSMSKLNNVMNLKKELPDINQYSKNQDL